MKILCYLPSLYLSGGLERVITLKANYFADVFDYNVTLLTSEQQGRKEYFPLSEKIKRHDLNVVIDKKYKTQFHRLLSYPVKYFLFKKRFSAFILKEKPDILISTVRRELNFINKLCDGSIKIGEFHVTRNSYHAISETDNKNTVKKLLNAYWQRSFVRNISGLSRFILLTHEEENYWPELGNTQVINNPLPFYPDKISSCENKKVIAVGRHSYQKGFDLLVNTWKIVTEKHPDWQLHIYGDGEREVLTKEVETLGISNSCFLHPPHSDITAKYIESSIFVFSSRYEGFGMALTEAMACGLPAVSFACPCGPRDIIKDGEDGILVENGNIGALADKICYLIEHEDERKKMGRKARENVQRFKMENIAVQWRKLFESLIGDKESLHNIVR